MRSTCCWCLLLAVAAHAPVHADSGPVSHAPKAVTVVLDYDEPGSPASLLALKAELANIFSDSQIRVALKTRSELVPGAHFEELVLFRMKGRCSMNALPVGALSDERGPLALTHAVNGELLPFGEVECDRVRESVRRSVGRGNPQAHESQLGTALARVMAHELYHMMARSATHTRDGVTKAALSPQELANGKLLFTPQAKASLEHH